MADQATVNGGARVPIHAPITGGVIGNLAGLGSDVATLAELQAKLAAHDLKEAAGAATVPAIGLSGGLVLALSCLPVALIGLSELVADWLGLAHRGWAYLIVAGVGLALGALLAFVFVRRLGPSFASLNRSREELARNVAWIKTVLAHSGRSPSQSRR